MDTLSALAVKVLSQLIRWLPVRLAGAIGAGLGRAGYYLDKRHRDVARRNLARIYPDRDRNWRQHIARESFAELGRTAFEMPHVFLRSNEFLLSRIDIGDLNAFDAAMKQGKGVILAACHHSNWELGSLIISLLGYSSDQMYRPLREPGLDTYLKTCRERFGATLHTRMENMRWILRALRQGSSIGLLIDQHLSNGTPVPFLGHMANTTTMPASFALKGTPVFGVILHRQAQSFRFRLEIQPIEMPQLSGSKAEDTIRVTQAVARYFEPMIHMRPELWLWTHRRWRILEQEAEIAEVVYGTP